MSLERYIKDNPGILETYPTGIHAVTGIAQKIKEELDAGVIFCLRKINYLDNDKNNSTLYPYYLVYVNQNGNIQVTNSNPKKILDIYKATCDGKKNIDKDLVFLHYRIDDIGRDRRVLPLEYYIEALETTRFNGGYITSDSLNHPNCTYLINKYNLKPVHGLSPMNTIFLGKNFNKLILSEGTFSWWIGFLSRAESIICNKRDFLWHGDIFLDRWKKLNWDYNENTPINLKNNL
jgi:hypothetical protein